MADSLNGAKRKALQTSIAALCVENGYLSADRASIEVLTQILQSYICEVGKSARSYCEMAQRLDPIVSDVEMALVDIGSKFEGMNQYANRLPRRHVGKQLRNYPPPQPKPLQVGFKNHKPKHIPSHLPPYPDQHSYIKTPIFPQPDVDYYSIKEKISDQQYHSTKSLSRLLARTQPSMPIAGEIDTSGLYILLPDKVSSSTPLYMSAIVLSNAPTNVCADAHGSAEGVDNKPEEKSECNDAENEPKLEERHSNDNFYTNPFLKPPSSINLQ